MLRLLQVKRHVTTSSALLSGNWSAVRASMSSTRDTEGMKGGVNVFCARKTKIARMKRRAFVGLTVISGSGCKEQKLRKWDFSMR